MLYPTCAAQFLAEQLPLLALVAALGLGALVAVLKKVRLPGGVGQSLGILVCIAFGVPALAEVYSFRSPIRDVVTQLVDSGETRLLASRQPVVQFYAGPKVKVLHVPRDENSLQEALEHGFCTAVLEYQGHVVPTPLWFTSTVLQTLEQRKQPRWAVPDPTQGGIWFNLEMSEVNGLTLRDTFAQHERLKREVGPASIRIYDTRDLLDIATQLAEQ
ncbi:MAG: hypothetical protein CL878_12305 [Dehalococcoidia bacterium]|nr:hypothetical protein [Dehalococcoidia bacterium]